MCVFISRQCRKQIAVTIYNLERSTNIIHQPPGFTSHIRTPRKRPIITDFLFGSQATTVWHYIR